MQKFIILTLTQIILTACSLLQPIPQNEMERLSDDVLQSKSGSGISIQITEIPKDQNVKNLSR